MWPHDLCFILTGQPSQPTGHWTPSINQATNLEAYFIISNALQSKKYGSHFREEAKPFGLLQGLSWTTHHFMAFYCFSVFCKGCLEQHIICSVALCINVNTYVRTSAHTQACALERGSILAVAKLRPGQKKKPKQKNKTRLRRETSHWWSYIHGVTTTLRFTFSFPSPSHTHNTLPSPTVTTTLSR